MNSSEHIRQQVVSLQQETDGMVADINYITQTVFQTVIYKLISLFRDFHLTKFCCSYRYESSIMNKKCSCFVIAKYCLTKRANYCLREAEAEFYSFIFILLFLGDSSIQSPGGGWRLSPCRPTKRPSISPETDQRMAFVLCCLADAAVHRTLHNKARGQCQ